MHLTREIIISKLPAAIILKLKTSHLFRAGIFPAHEFQLPPQPWNRTPGNIAFPQPSVPDHCKADMANRQITRRITISAAISLCLIFFLFIRPQGPPSPAIRAPGHIDHSAPASVPAITIHDSTLKGDVVMPKLGNETVKAELGRATWKYFHTVMARFPETPTDDQKEALRSYIYLFARLYPCGECAEHFQQHLKKYPPQVSSRNAASGWACFIHNEVNAMLDKPEFDCANLGDFYDCGCKEDEGGKGEEGSAASRSDAAKEGTRQHDGPAVEISKEDGTDAPGAIIESVMSRTRRFERIHYVVEPVEEYRAGGYHPVHLEDTFHDRYRIVGKWAYGQFSTVWIAEDTRLLERYVTLKILKADISSNSQESSILQHLSEADTHHPGKPHVLQLLDQFEHEGPNGLHLCLVFPVMMSDGEEITMQQEPRFPDYVREISKQILLGLKYLHDQGLIHGDLQPANILFTQNCDFTSDMFKEPEFSPVKWLPGVEIDNSAPQYLMCSQRPYGMLASASSSTLLVKIGDMGGAMWNTQDKSRPVTPVALRAPELLQPHSWNEKADIWALGCLIFQLATNEPLFPILAWGCTTDEVHELLRSLMRKLFENGNQRFAVYLSERLPTDFGKENTEQLANLLWSTLQERPEDRESTARLLNHPFLVG
ncbi:uncharacterized protein N7515_009204 [Penicillium bovifimosum]|uniref:Sulfhydryl oxidase n=1 Tax=Penicillium bovifimosum TaxID=126998 RepID=A0A9W9GIU3_9EURO|nr:uncharacterized protein N7515_009204 [Penicillium bovifimosum]KAJ5121243.1 hypothetical protein N7515_009204 [Penicillium bovifimosum]